MRARKQADARSASLIRKSASICLSYPGIGFAIQLVLVERAVEELDDAVAGAVRRFTAWAASQDPYELATAYVETFAQRDCAPLYLTWWTAGDAGVRAEQIAGFIAAYRGAGYEYGGEEPPDHLPIVLDFASCAGESASQAVDALLGAYRGALVELREWLGRGDREGYGGHGAALIDLVLTTIPAEPGETRSGREWSGGCS